MQHILLTYILVLLFCYDTLYDSFYMTTERRDTQYVHFISNNLLYFIAVLVNDIPTFCRMTCYILPTAVIQLLFRCWGSLDKTSRSEIIFTNFAQM